MSCSFCRNARHTKTICNDPYIIDIAAALLTTIETKINVSNRHSYSRSLFTTNMRTWLDSKSTRELKIISEFLRRKGVEFRRIPPSNRGTNKPAIIDNIIDCIITVYNVTFRYTPPHTPSTENVPSTPPRPAVQEPLNLINIIDYIDIPTPANVILSIERQRRIQSHQARASFQTPPPFPHHTQDHQARAPFQPPPPPARSFIEISKFEEKCNTEDCCICYNPMTDADFVQLNCNHQYCKSCIKKWMSIKTNTSCPMCRTKITTIKTQNPIVRYEL
jgi:hypothetical protein